MEKEEKFYKLTKEEVIFKLKSSYNGLNNKEREERLKKYGLNQLVEEKEKTIIQKFIYQFKDLMIIILLLAALLSIIASHGEEWVDAIIILIVVLLNAAFGVYQEGKAEQAIKALKKMASTKAKVKSENQIIEIESNQLVPGDIVILEAGDIVPADMRLIEVNSLKVEEATLTGESIPVEKSIKEEILNDVPLAERYNMVYQNSNITYGRGIGIVTNTGMTTEVGKIANMLKNTDEKKTPLKQNLYDLSKILSYIILIIAIITFCVGVFINNQPPITGLLTSVALAVAAIPEGLPAIVTVILSLGTQELAKEKAIVRKLPAVETLGSTEIICSDKTGTLTLNKMTVEKIYVNNEVKNTEQQIDELLIKIMCFANDTNFDNDGNLLGDPTEIALINLGLKKEYDLKKELITNPRVKEFPFDSERKMMSTIHQQNENYFVAIKGAPDQLINRITKININGDIREISQEEKKEILSISQKFAKQALRVLMFAYKEIDDLTMTSMEETENNLIFVGLVGMIDPEREEAKEAINVAKQAGIIPIMITGDHRDTAEAIAKRLGIIDENQSKAIITGKQLNEMSDEEFAQKIEEYRVYARVSPQDKVKIVKFWQEKEKIVAMTGDGVNDAPSLKAADIGIGMGITGTEVSKGASDIILADDNYKTIIVAVKEGRKIFTNIQKTIQYLLSANLAEVLTIFIATLLSWDVLLPIHLLWINLVTDTFPAIALGLEPAEPNIMLEKPRGKNTNFLSNGIKSSIIYQGVLQAFIVLFVYYCGIKFPTSNNYETIHQDALTMAYITLGLIQLVHAFNVKSIHNSIFSINPLKNKIFNFGILISFLLLILTIITPGINTMFGLSTLSLNQWLVIICGSLSMLIITELIKWIYRKNNLTKK